jgi:3',5'-cyclic AMP phosphodiesterase CpdA
MKDKIILILISILIILSNSIVNGDIKHESSIIIGPFPQNTNQDSTYIIWQTDIKTLNNSVHFGLYPNCNNIIYNNNLTDFHKIKIFNLNHSTKYYYKVVSDEFKSDIYCFHTSFEEKNSIKFISFGDTRGVWDKWKNASIVAKAINKEQPNFVLHTGDFVKDGRNISQWIDFFSISDYVHNCTIYPILGNHEYYGDSYFQYFELPGNKYWYSFDNGPIHFIGLDSNKKNLFNLSQIIWLYNDLKSNEKSYTIVFFHHPPYSSGNHGSSYLIRLLWKPIFSIFNVDIVINGHDHSYERGKVNNVYYIVTGGGGAPLYKIGEKWWTIHSERSYNYCLINADQNELFFQAKKPDGSVIDSFIIIN